MGLVAQRFENHWVRAHCSFGQLTVILRMVVHFAVVFLPYLLQIRLPEFLCAYYVFEIFFCCKAKWLQMSRVSKPHLMIEVTSKCERDEDFHSGSETCMANLLPVGHNWDHFLSLAGDVVAEQEAY